MDTDTNTAQTDGQLSMELSRVVGAMDAAADNLADVRRKVERGQAAPGSKLVRDAIDAAHAALVSNANAVHRVTAELRARQ